jgi:segregation and condensation protein B
VSPEDQSRGNAAGGEGVGGDAVDWPGDGRPGDGRPGDGRPDIEISPASSETGAGGETSAGGETEGESPTDAGGASEPARTTEIAGNPSLSRGEVETFLSSQDIKVGLAVHSSPPPGSPSMAETTTTRNSFIDVALPADDAPEISPPNAGAPAEAEAAPKTNPPGAERPAEAAELEINSLGGGPRAQETPDTNPPSVERPPLYEAASETNPASAEPRAAAAELETSPHGAERPMGSAELDSSTAGPRAAAEETPVSGPGPAAEEPSAGAIGPAPAAESPAEAALLPGDAPAQPSADPHLPDSTQVREEATDHVALAAGPSPDPPAAERAGAAATATGLPEPDRAVAPSSAGADSAPPTSSASPETGESLLAPDLADPAAADETGTAAAAETAGPDGATAPAETAPPATDPEPGTDPGAAQADGSLFGADLVVADASLDVPERLRATLEAVLLVVDQPTSAMLLAQVLGRPVGLIEAALRHLRDEYDAGQRGLDLREVAGGWRLYTRDEFAIHVERFVLEGQATRLTQAALETLAVIAYRQPITRSRVSAVRGVNVDAVMRTLLSRGLVEECGSDAETGGGLYRTTQLFLERLGISSLDELPSLAPLLPDTSQLDDVALST